MPGTPKKWTPPILAKKPLADGSTAVTVGTVDYSQAQVVIAPGLIDSPDIAALYDHVSDMRTHAYTARRVGRKDEKRGK